MSQKPLSQALHFEKKNKDMIKLPKHARVQKRPIPHAPIASPYAGSSVPKTVYVSTSTPFMSAVKRVQKLLRQAEKRATASVELSNSRKRDQQKLAAIAQGGEQLCREAVFVKASGRAIERAVAVGRWFEGREGEYVVSVKTGSVLVVDDVVEGEKGEGKKQGGEEVDSKSGGESAAKKRKCAADDAAEDESELPETRTRWVNTVEISVALK